MLTAIKIIIVSLLFCNIAFAGPNLIANGNFKCGRWGWTFDSGSNINAQDFEVVALKVDGSDTVLKMPPIHESSGDGNWGPDSAPWYIASFPFKLKSNTQYTYSYEAKKDATAQWDTGEMSVQFNIFNLWGSSGDFCTGYQTPISCCTADGEGLCREYDVNASNTSFDVDTTSWVQKTGTFTTPTTTHLYFYARIWARTGGSPRYFAEDEFALIRNVKIEEGNVAEPTYETKATIELGVDTDQIANIFYDTASTYTIKIAIYNSDGSTQIPKIWYQVLDWNYNIVETNNFTQSVNANSVYTKQIDLKSLLNTGKYYIVAWVNTYNDSEAYLPFSIVKPDRGLTGTQSFSGTHIRLKYPWGISVITRLGFKNTRALSVAQYLERWNQIETSDGVYYSTAGLNYISNANTYGIDILAVLNTEGVAGSPNWHKYETTTLNFDKTANTITAPGVDLTADKSFAAGDEIAVMCSTCNQAAAERQYWNDNNSYMYTIDSISYTAGNTVITLDSGDTLWADEDSSENYAIISATAYAEFCDWMTTTFSAIKNWTGSNENTKGQNTFFARCSKCSARFGEIANSYVEANVTNGIFMDFQQSCASGVSAALGNPVSELGGTFPWDVIDIHCYGNDNGSQNETDVAYPDTNVYMEDAGVHMWNTETGISYLTDFVNLPFEEWNNATYPTGYLPANLGRQRLEDQIHNYVYFLQENYGSGTYGGRKYFKYGYRSGGGMQYLMYRKAHNDLFNDPKMTTIAFSLFINLFDNPTTFGKELSIGGTDDIAYQWEITDGTPYVILFTDDANKTEENTDVLFRKVTLSNNYTVYDMMLNQISASTTVVEFTDLPVYVTPVGEVTTAQMKTDFEAGTYANVTDIVDPNVAIIQSPRGAVVLDTIYKIRAISSDNVSRQIGNALDRLQYSFKSTGDIGTNDWSAWSSNNYIEYTASASGSTYTVQVRAKDNDDNISDPIILTAGEPEMLEPISGLQIIHQSGGMSLEFDAGGLTLE